MDKSTSVEELATLFGVSDATVINWEIRNRKPYRKTEEKLKAVLDLKEEISI